MKTKFLGATMLGAAAVALTATPAHAQRIDRIVAFGDSYADDGNAFELGGIDPLSTSVYPTGRFSGGLVYIDILGQLLNAEIDNFAIGGAQANGLNVNAGLPGFGFEVQSYLAGGNLGIPGVPNAFPNVIPAFRSNDLVAVSIGGNDARSYQLNGGDMAGLDAAVAVSVAGAQQGLDALVAAGAQNISFLAGDTANLPEVVLQPDPAGAAMIRSAYSTAYNDQLRGILGGYASQGVMVHYLDLAALSTQLSDNLSAYGFTGEACPFFNPADPSSLVCATDSSVASQNVFYGDGVHLTTAGFDVVARYVAAQTTAPLTLNGPRQLVADNARSFQNVIMSRLDGGSPRDGGTAQGIRFFVQGDYASRTAPISAETDPYRNESKGVSAGVEFGFGLATIGVVGRYSMPEGDIITGAAETESTSISGAIYGSTGIGPLFIQAYGGIGSDDLELERAGVVSEFALGAETDADHLIAGAKAGYLGNLFGIRMGPAIGIDYVDVDVDGYVESGDPVLNLNVGDTKLNSTRIYGGLEGRTNTGYAGASVSPYLGIYVEQELGNENETILFSQTSAPEIVNRWTLDGTGDDLYGRLRGGLTAQIGGALHLNAAMTTTLDKDHGDETGATLGLSLAF